MKNLKFTRKTVIISLATLLVIALGVTGGVFGMAHANAQAAEKCHDAFDQFVQARVNAKQIAVEAEGIGDLDQKRDDITRLLKDEPTCGEDAPTSTLKKQKASIDSVREKLEKATASLTTALEEHELQTAQNELDALSEDARTAIDEATQLLDDTDGEVEDEQTRTDLKDAIADLKTALELEVDDTDVTDLNSASHLITALTDSLKDSHKAVKESHQAYTQAQQAATSNSGATGNAPQNSGGNAYTPPRGNSGGSYTPPAHKPAPAPAPPANNGGNSNSGGNGGGWVET
ncbi:MAG: hypothetical protein Q4P05_08930, partial [Actinomycetaceae bacterium]|nr:hypothetical protein [Actinomycetaceae bacterium]